MNLTRANSPSLSPPPLSLPPSPPQNAAENQVAFPDLDGSNVRVGIIKTRWNTPPVESLLKGCKEALTACKVPDANVFVTEVPGAFELPYAARLLALSGTVDAVVCLGVLVKGDTQHFEYISSAVSDGIMSVGLQTNVPCVFGVLTCENDEQVCVHGEVMRTTTNNFIPLIQLVLLRSPPQVKVRSEGSGNHGQGWGMTAVEMALLRSEALGGGKKAAMGFGAPVPVGSGAASAGPKVSQNSEEHVYSTISL